MAHSWQRGCNPLFYEGPTLYYIHITPYITPYITYITPFLKFVHPPHPYCCLRPLPQLLFRLSSFFGYMVDPNTFDVLLYLILLWIYTCQALVHFKTKRPSYILKKFGKKNFLWQKVWKRILAKNLGFILIFLNIF